MKTPFKILFFILIFIQFNSYGQEKNRRSIISKSNLTENTTFIINGIAYDYTDSLRLDMELEKIDLNKIVNVSILRDNTETFIHRTRGDVLMIEYATIQPEKNIRKQFKKVKRKYKHLCIVNCKYYRSKEPLLFINGESIQQTERKKTLNQLKTKDIGFIYIQKPLSKEHSGEDVNNGKVTIWTKDKLEQD